MKIRELYVPDRYAIAITSMVRIKNKIYLGLTGGPRILAVYDIDKEVITLEKELFPWLEERGYCGKIHNSLGMLSNGSLLLGECSHFTWDGIPVTVNYFNRELPERMLARKKKQGFPDVKYSDFCLENLESWNRPMDDPGGKILRYIPQTEQLEIIAHLPQYLYVHSMVVDTKRNRAFGHTIPDNHFFYFDIGKNEFMDFGHISDYAHHNMVITPEGICYGGWIDKADGSLKLLKFNPDEKRLRYLNEIILRDPGSKVAGNQGIDQWIVTQKGEIYMGVVSNSLLFRFYDKEEKFELIGQLAKGGRVTSLDEDKNGCIWIGADYPHMRLIKFDPTQCPPKCFTDFGRINTTYERCYFHASCYYDNKLYLGETDGFSPSLHIVDLKEL